MAIGKGQRETKYTSSELSSRTWENISFKCFFFFSTGSHAILWPWIAVLLQRAHLPFLGIGASICLINLLELIGIKISSCAFNKTRNGTVRRFLLLGFYSMSLLLSFPTVFLVPPFPKDMFCNSHVIPSHSSMEVNISSIYDVKATNTQESIFNVSKDDVLSTEKPHNFLYDIISKLKPLLAVNKQSIPEKNYSDANNVIQNFETEMNNNGIISSSIKPENTLTTSSPFTLKESSIIPTHFLSEDIQKNINNYKMLFKGSNKTEIPSWNNKFPFSPRFTTSNPYQNSNTSENYKTEKLLLNEKYTDDPSLVTDSEQNVVLRNNLQLKQSIQMNGNSDLDDKFENSEKIVPAKENIFLNNIHYQENEDNSKPPMENFPYLPYRESAVTTQLDESYRKTHDLPDSHNFFDKNIKQIDYEPPLIFTHKYRNKRQAEISDMKFNATDNVLSLNGIFLAVLLILSSFFNGGVESSISKVWFSMKYGLFHDVEAMDDLELSIIHNFRLYVLGDHRHWSLWTRSFWVSLASLSVAVMCQIAPSLSNPFISLGVVHGLTGVMSIFVLLFLPMPHGNLGNSKAHPPLSLYLDDEVIREGLRRVSFHGWVLVSGILMALPYFYNMWLLQQTGEPEGQVFLAQSISILTLHLGEVVVYPANRWISRKFGVPGTMFASGVCMWTYCLTAFACPNLWARCISMIAVGQSIAFMWIVIQTNALFLGNSRDQEQEAWASWISWKVGLSLGSFLWAATLEMNWFHGSIRELLFPALMFGVVSTTALVIITTFTRQSRRGRRRVYHTLDLDVNFDDDELTSTEEETENDWLVKRAKKEGLML